MRIIIMWGREERAFEKLFPKDKLIDMIFPKVSNRE